MFMKTITTRIRSKGIRFKVLTGTKCTITTSIIIIMIIIIIVVVDRTGTIAIHGAIQRIGSF
jgi:hypothetical protein